LVSLIIITKKAAWEECKETFSKEKVIIVSNSAGTNDDIGYKDK
jgi:phosphatidylglycerophosphatase GEP4